LAQGLAQGSTLFRVIVVGSFLPCSCLLYCFIPTIIRSGMYTHTYYLVLFLCLLPCERASRRTARVHVVGDKGRQEGLYFPTAAVRVRTPPSPVVGTRGALTPPASSAGAPASRLHPMLLRPTPRGRLHTALLRMLMDDPEIDPREPAPAPDRRAPPSLPMVGTGDDKLDVMSRLLRDRIVILGQQVDDEVANRLVAQLLYLANEDPAKDITMYINSPGGSVSAGMAIFDTMNFVPCDVSTVCFGTAASMGAFLLGAGTKGKRRSLPNSRIMIHQPLGGAQGQAADIEIQAKEILFIRALLCEYIADYTGQPVDKIESDCDRDFFMTPREALDYGIIDEVLPSKVRVPTPSVPPL